MAGMSLLRLRNLSSVRRWDWPSTRGIFSKGKEDPQSAPTTPEPKRRKIDMAADGGFYPMGGNIAFQEIFRRRRMMSRLKQGTGKIKSFWSACAGHVRQLLAPANHGDTSHMGPKKNVFQLEPMSTCSVEVDVIVRDGR